MSSTSHTLEEALSSLPHGPEFRFLDRLLSLVPGKQGVAEFQTQPHGYASQDEPTGQIVFPLMLLVEAGAQLAGVVAQNDPAVEPLPRLRLTAIRNCKNFRPVSLGEKVRLEVVVSGRLGALVQAEAFAYVAGTLAMSVGLTLSGTGPANVDKHPHPAS